MTPERRGDDRVPSLPLRPRRFAIRPTRRSGRPLPPAAALVVLFAILVAVGTLLLSLPISTRSGEATRLVDALLTATSAACVTGLVVFDTATHWSPFGQVVILLLIQAGGFGIMAGSTLLLFLFLGRRTTLRDRVIVQESLGGIDLGSVTSLLRRIALFTFACEALGAIVLSIAFASASESGSRGWMGDAWWGVFHSISAFNNAGFDLTGDFASLIPFADDWIVLGALAVLIVLGGLGFAIVGDVVGRRGRGRLALETKLVLATTAILLVGGAVGVALTEWSNPATLGSLPVDLRVLNATFESVTLRSAGFSALDTGAFADSTLFIAMALMFVGGASGSTGGGIKVNTLGVLLAASVSTVRGQRSAVAFGRRIQHTVVYRGLAVVMLSVVFVLVVTVGLAVTHEATFVQLMFEAVSAFGTVGVSTGITPELSDPARLILSIGMFVGRLGPLTLVLALAARDRPPAFRPAVEAVRIG